VVGSNKSTKIDVLVGRGLLRPLTAAPIMLKFHSFDLLWMFCIQFAKILYSALGWAGFCSAADRERLDAFLRRCKRLHYCDDNLPAINNLLQDADSQLFKSVSTNTEHILQHYIPEHASHYHHHLRPRVHNKEVIPKTRTLNDRDFIIRMLYRKIKPTFM